MKKIISIIATVIMMVALCITMTACSASIVGTYKLETMTTQIGNEKITLEVGKDYNGDTVEADDVVFTINNDKTWTMKSDVMGKNFDANGTWEERDGKYYLAVEGMDNHEIEATLDGNKLTLKAAGWEVVAKK